MRIQGVVTVEGVNLHVDIEAPDEERELYVTNVHPTCLVIPRERWRIEYLGLSPEALAELRERRFTTLGQLMNGTWKLGADGLSEETRRNVDEALTRFQEIALTFDIPAAPAIASSNRSGSNGSDEPVVAASTALQTDLAVVGLLKPQEDSLRKNRGVRTFNDLLTLGRRKLLMTGSMDDRAVQKVESALRQVGLELPE